MAHTTATLFAYLALSSVLSAGSTADAADRAVADPEAFGERPWAEHASLSPDAKRLVFVAPAAGAAAAAAVLDLKTGDTKAVLSVDGIDQRLGDCGWASNDRIICRVYGQVVHSDIGQRVVFARTLAADVDHPHVLPLTKPNPLGRRDTMDDGRVIDWLDGDGTVLMTRDNVPQIAHDTNIQRIKDGLSVERVDTRTGRGTVVVPATNTAVGYLADGRGEVRVAIIAPGTIANIGTNVFEYRYRPPGGGAWATFSRVDRGTDRNGPGLRPIAVDGGANVAYALDNRNGGRDALYRVALDGSLKTELVFADPVVDVDDVVTIGRHHRVIGLTYNTDRRHIVYFDPGYRELARKLSAALPDAPQISFESASADERKLLILAGGDVDPGRFYLLDRDTNKMTEVLLARPMLNGVRLATVKAVSYPAADGTMIPGYLTLPPGGPDRGLPAIVMPHGGPSYRDEWGFDWLTQFFASQGFAVLQPEFRGSSGYGTAFANGNAMRSWRKAIGDVVDAGRWLVRQGIADPSRLSIVGWSYGGYAALQANVVDPGLFKAAVAIAPVTDFGMLREQYRAFANFYAATREIGTGPEAAAGSPDRHADAFKAPVLMFHGDHDTNVDIRQSRAMSAALTRAGVPNQLIVYPGLDHQLDDSAARIDMLTKAAAFLKAPPAMAKPD